MMGPDGPIVKSFYQRAPTTSLNIRRRRRRDVGRLEGTLGNGLEPCVLSTDDHETDNHVSAWIVTGGGSDFWSVLWAGWL